MQAMSAFLQCEIQNFVEWTSSAASAGPPVSTTSDKPAVARKLLNELSLGVSKALIKFRELRRSAKAPTMGAKKASPYLGND
jgi:hypothetical protein